MKQPVLKSILAFTCLAMATSAIAQSQCNNQDFEDSTFVNWAGATGMNYYGLLQPVTWTPGYVSNGNNAAVSDVNARQTIITTNFLDPNVTDPATMQPDTQMTSLAPGGGIASVRIGNSNINYECEKLSFQFAVTAANPWFQFQYASVMQDPGHMWNEQPYLMINFYDQAGAPIVTVNDTIWAADTSVPFIVSGNAPDLLYRRWTPQSRDLSAYVGQNVTVEFVNSDCMYGGHFGYTYIDVSCIGAGIPNVWPGDADYDLQANNVDVLTLGVAYGATGTPRAGATTNWQAEPSADWAQSVPLGANYKHADTNGDGVVDLNDTLAISLNYAQTHTYRMGGPSDVDVESGPMLYLSPQADTVAPNSYAYIDVYLANASMPVNNLYGLSFTVNYDNTLVQSGTVSTSYSGSFVGVKNSSMLAFSHDDYAAGVNDITLCRLTHTEVNGYGYVGTIRVLTSAVTSMSTLNLEISNVKAIDGQMVSIPLTSMGAPVVIDPASGVTTNSPVQHIGIYPNPASENVVISSEKNETIQISNTLGQVVYSTSANSTSTTIDVSAFEAGVYFVTVSNGETESTERLIIQ